MNFSISLFIIFVIKATLTESMTYTLNKGDPFICYCEISTKLSLEWILQKVNGQEISLVRECYTPFTSCDIRYDPANFTLVTEARYAFMHDSSLPQSFESRLTVKHVDKDMRRVFCTNDVLYGRDRCWMNVVDYVPPDDGTSKSPTTYSPRLPSTTQSSVSINAGLVFSCSILPFVGVIGISILVNCFINRWSNRKALQRRNEAMPATSNTPQLTPVTVPRSYQNEQCSTNVNPLVYPSNNTPVTQSPQHTASIQSPAPNDSPPPYSSLNELRVEPPPYTILPAESYNCESAPSQQAQNVPPPYTTTYIATYNSVSPSAQQQATTEPPPPYSVWHTS
ncbi:uncharacterized protein LOC131934797 [Physella acuta]|uniref:uncharacterized protein LOC131934797 n=1 Tax=Physella acuta TaxID=109671 RepID=UPI0027DE4DD3|nr:uncharacterized protein LOC131934797 [Physella acuta]